MTKKGKLIGPYTAAQLGVSENHVFVDTNVLVGGYSGDNHFQKDKECLRYLYSLKGKRLFISTLSVAQLISMFQKKKKNDEITRIVRELQHRFVVINFTNRDIDAALEETGADIEEDDGEHQSSVQYVLAMKQKSSIIITNNYKDYRHFFNIRVVRPSWWAVPTTPPRPTKSPTMTTGLAPEDTRAHGTMRMNWMRMNKTIRRQV